MIIMGVNGGKGLFLFFQFEVVAADKGSPSQSTDFPSNNNARVSLTILRNDYGPYFINLPNTTTIIESISTSIPFFRVVADDDDTTV